MSTELAGKDGLELHSLGLASGQGVILEYLVPLEPVHLAGQDYGVEPAPLPVRLDVSRTLTGFALRLRFEAIIRGSCMRCLEDAAMKVDVDAREVDQPGTGDEELESPYVERDTLDLLSWTRDALLLGSPTRVLCREDCAGLCPTCGETLNNADPADHDHGPDIDPRWAGLGEIRFE